MKRLINVRIPVLIACLVALGVLSGYLFCFHNAEIILLIAVVPVTAIVFIFAAIFRKKKLLIVTAILTVVFVGGTLNSFYRLENFSACEVNTTDIYTVTGTVEEKGVTDYGEYVILKDAEANGEKLSGKIKVFLPTIYGDYCDNGYRIEFKGKINFNDAFPYGELNYYAEQNIKYTSSPYGEITAQYHYSFFGSIRSAIRNALYGNLSYDTASICYGMLLGDTQNVDGEALNNFRYGGIAHIFAVSGLHIGIIYGIFTFIFNKTGMNKYVSAVLRVAAIVFYSGICGFTVSSVRAVVMCAVNMLTHLFHVKSDGLNNLSFAVTLILFITPLSLFSAGFQLSVCAVGGIILLSNKIRQILTKIKTPNCVSTCIGTMVGAQVGTLPVMTAKFGYISGAGLLLNLFIIPLITPLFVLTFIGTIVSATIPPVASYVLPYCVLPLEATLSFLLNANFESALLTGFGSGPFVPLFFAVMLLFSDKLNLKAVPRSIFAGIGTAALAVCVLLLTYYPSEGYKISVSGSNSGGSVIVKSGQGNILVMTQYASLSRVKSFLNSEYSTELDGVIILGDDYCLESYDLSLNCDDIYICSLYIPVQPFSNCDVHYEHCFTLCGIDFEFIDGHNLIFDLNGVRVGVCESENIAVKSCDLLVSMHENYDYDNKEIICNAVQTVYFNLKEYNSAYNRGSLTFLADNGQLKAI